MQELKIDKTFLILLIALMFVIGGTVSYYINNQEWERVAQNAEGKLCLKTCKQKLAEQQAKQQAPKRQHINLITITLSDVCLAQVKNNLTGSCPTYKDIVKYDTTNQKISGKFVDDSYHHRGKPQMRNHFEMYRGVEPIICVDCSLDAIIASKQIIIKGSSFPYILDKDNTIKNSTRFVYHDRSVEACKIATIAYSDALLNDTISYLASGCKVTSFDEKETIVMEKSVHDPKTTQAYKNKQFIKQAQEEAKKRAEEYCKKQGSKCK
jgi:hypothetical protein